MTGLDKTLKLSIVNKTRLILLQNTQISLSFHVLPCICKGALSVPMKMNCRLFHKERAIDVLIKPCWKSEEVLVHLSAGGMAISLYNSYLVLELKLNNHLYCKEYVIITNQTVNDPGGKLAVGSQCYRSAQM